MSGDFVGFEFGEKTNTSKINTDNWNVGASAKTGCMNNGAITTKNNDKVTAFKRWAGAFLALLAQIDKTNLVALFL